jgi:hypothetical protein
MLTESRIFQHLAAKEDNAIFYPSSWFFGASEV